MTELERLKILLEKSENGGAGYKDRILAIKNEIAKLDPEGVIEDKKTFTFPSLNS